MKFYKIILYSSFSLLLFSCSKENGPIENIKDEFVFSEKKDNLSELSNVLGMTNFSDGKFSSNNFYFKINGNNVNINGDYINLDNSKVKVEKIGSQNFKINLESLEFGDCSLLINGNDFTLSNNGKVVSLKNSKTLSKSQMILAVVLTDIFEELKTNNSNFQNNILINRVENERSVKSYYGYTIGWGATREESIDHEGDVRGGAADNISQYHCFYLGTSTSCLWESLGCVTISTFKCSI